MTQSDWMANNKTKAFWPAFCHAIVYSLPFALITGVTAWCIIFGTHFLIDRYRLARFLVWAKNVVFSPLVVELVESGAADPELTKQYDWENCSATGYPSERPAWLATWLLIAADNTVHLAINEAAIHFFPR